jgi:hypothetical protein
LQAAIIDDGVQFSSDIFIRSRYPAVFHRYGSGDKKSNLTNDELLIGARRPHVPKMCQLYKDEVLVRAEFQWDGIMRWMNFTSNL